MPCGRSKKDFCAEIKKKNSACNLEPHLLLDESRGDKGQTQTCQGSVKGIRRGRPQTGNKPGLPTTFERAADAEDADGADRSGHGKFD